MKQDIGERFGMHRVVSPPGVLPQQALVVDPSLPLRSSELLIEVESLNIDSASFHQIKEACASDLEKMKQHIADIVQKRGKQHNPVTGSGGMLLGKVKEIGGDFQKARKQAGESEIKVGDRIATLVSLTLTPLVLKEIRKIWLELDRVDVTGHAILFETGIFAKLPTDIPENLALAILDVCGAPAQARALCQPGQTVVILGAAGKSGLLCLYEAAKAVGPQGKVIALDYSDASLEIIKNFSFAGATAKVDARNAMEVLSTVSALTNGKMADLVINVTNIPDTEMGSILAAKPGGTAYFFSMATSFTKAALGAEGVGADVELIMGNGYRPGHADLALQILRDSKEIRKFYESKYGAS